MNYIKRLNKSNELLNQIRTPEFLNKLKTLPSETLKLITGSVLMVSDINTSFLFWKKNGSKIFVLSEHLIEAFQNTDIPQKLTSGDFNYPFDTFIVESRTKPLFTTKIKDIDCPVYVLMYSYERKFSNENIVPMIDTGFLTGTSNKLLGRDIGHDRGLFGFFFTSRSSRLITSP